MTSFFRPESVLSDIDDHTYSATPKVYFEEVVDSTMHGDGDFSTNTFDGKNSFQRWSPTTPVLPSPKFFEAFSHFTPFMQFWYFSNFPYATKLKSRNQFQTSLILRMLFISLLDQSNIDTTLVSVNGDQV